MIEYKNKVIAEFMGASFNDKGMTRICGKFGLERVSDLNLKYHTSWDWLMPVVEKCLTTDGQHYVINDALLTCNIDELYQSVLQFIKQQKL